MTEQLEWLQKQGYPMSVVSTSAKPRVIASLKKTNLKKTNLKKTNLKKTNLKKTNLKKPNLKKPNLKMTDLKKTNLMRFFADEHAYSATNDGRTRPPPNPTAKNKCLSFPSPNQNKSDADRTLLRTTETRSLPDLNA